MPLVFPYAAKFAAHFVIVDALRTVSIYEKSKRKLPPYLLVSEAAGNFSRISRPPRHRYRPCCLLESLAAKSLLFPPRDFGGFGTVMPGAVGFFIP